MDGVQRERAAKKVREADIRWRYRHPSGVPHYPERVGASGLGWKFLGILITTGQFLGFDTEWVFLVLATLGVVVLGAWIVMSNRAGNAVYWAWLLACLGHWFWVLGTFVRAADGCASGAENCYSSGYYALFLTSVAASIVLYLINNDRDAHESANAEWRQALREQGGGDGNA